MKLSAFILDNIEPIIQQWEDFAKTIFPSNQKVSVKKLRNDIKKILISIVNDLTNTSSSYNQNKLPKGFLAHNFAHKTSAGTHGLIRMEQGFNINEVIAEFRALRKSVISLYFQSSSIRNAVDPTQLIHFNESIDKKLSEAVAIYDFNKEQQTRRFSEMLTSTPILSYILDLDGKFIYVNKAMIDLYQKPAHLILGASVYAFEMPSKTKIKEHIKTILKTGQQVRGQGSYNPPSKNTVYLEYVFAPVFDEQGKIEAIAGTLRDITEQKLSEKQIWINANYDLLTSLPNRLMFIEKLEQTIKHCKRSNKSFALMFIDLDNFKKINDTLGHEGGDHLLTQVAERISSCIRDADTASRIGGDEFTVILTDICDIKETMVAGEKILAKLVKPFQIKNTTLHISGSIGIALSPKDGIEPEVLLSNADKAMYSAKNAGGNQITFYKDQKK